MHVWLCHLLNLKVFYSHFLLQHFRVGGGISWKEQADVILASLSVGAVMQQHLVAFSCWVGCGV